MKSKYIETKVKRALFDFEGVTYTVQFRAWLIRHSNGNQYGYDADSVTVWNDETGEDASHYAEQAALEFLTDYHTGDDRGAY